MSRKDIIHPVFLSCIQYAKDPFWKTLFEDLAYGKVPADTYISKNTLCCNNKKKNFRYKIVSTKSPELIYEEVYKLLHNRLGIFSTKEKASKLVSFNRAAMKVQEKNMEWSDIKKKNTKDHLIQLFVSDMRKKYSLNTQKSKQLLSLLFIAIMFKAIGNKDIHYSNGSIQSVDGLVFTKGNYHFNHDLYSRELGFAPEDITPTNIASREWAEYLKLLNKVSC